ncbi:ester cyclase [Haloferax marisrubri]|nr:ester cyclase [Haloferax marisrubri]
MADADTRRTETRDAGPMLPGASAAEFADAYVELWNTRNYAAIPRLVSESFVMYDPAAPAEGIPGPKREVHGRDGLRQFVEGVTTGYPDFEITVLELLAGDGVVMYEARLTGTHDGPLDGLPPTGRMIDIRVVSVLRLDGDYISEHRAYFDMREVAEQLGLTFPTVIRQAPRLVAGKLRGGL